MATLSMADDWNMTTDAVDRRETGASKFKQRAAQEIKNLSDRLSAFGEKAKRALTGQGRGDHSHAGAYNNLNESLLSQEVSGGGGGGGPNRGSHGERRSGASRGGWGHQSRQHRRRPRGRDPFPRGANGADDALGERGRRAAVGDDRVPGRVRRKGET